jgi:hypothetical protein|tara:strand:- start:229 stop:516 length:288 start_codon:yes stop_codon:yes gene_type:complete
MGITATTPGNWDAVRKDTKTTVFENDMVNSPNHYVSTSSDIECIDAIRASMTLEAFRGYCKGAALKYLWRYERKSKSLEDLHKSEWYTKKLISTY